MTAAIEYLPEKDFVTQFEKLSNVLNAFAYNLTKNNEDAKDLYQETAFRVMTNREKFKMGTNFKAWTFTIMKNIFINNYRKKMKVNTIIDSTENLYYLNSNSKSIDNKGESNLMMDEISKIIENLEETTKIPFLMHFRGYKYQEIADHFEIPLGTIKSRIFFARKELQNKIEKRLYN